MMKICPFRNKYDDVVKKNITSIKVNFANSLKILQKTNSPISNNLI